MQTTTNFGFSIAEGSDSVNLLTQLYPNFTSLDGILLPIQNNGTTPATHTKAGTVHQLVRTTTGCAVLRFVATGNYNAGDTFTVDGASVTATSCNGQSLPTGAFVINQSVMAIVNGAVLTVLAGGSSISDASDVNYDNTGSGLTATNVQDAIDEVVSDIPTGFPASAITYDNSGSGLTATTTQDAIDELAQGGGGGGTEHGLYELWKNPDPTQDFSAQTVTISGIDPSKYDGLMFFTADGKIGLFSGFEMNLGVSVIDKDMFNRANIRLTVTHADANLSFGHATRVIGSITTGVDSITIVFNPGYLNATQNNSYGIPYRILGYVHNS